MNITVQPLIPNRNFTDLEVPLEAVSLARKIVSLLIRAGVEDIVICPGSRNAPLTYAVAAAEAAGRIRAHVKIDERSAGFYALGLSRSSQVRKLRAVQLVDSEGNGKDHSINEHLITANGMRPVAIMVTSGTAVGELHPAILEAHHVGAPLIVITADRPKYMVGTGANQTTNQEAIYGWAVQGCLQVEACGLETDQTLIGGEEDGLGAIDAAWRNSGWVQTGCDPQTSPVNRPDMQSRIQKQDQESRCWSKHPSAIIPVVSAATVETEEVCPSVPFPTAENPAKKEAVELKICKYTGTDEGAETADSGIVSVKGAGPDRTGYGQHPSVLHAVPNFHSERTEKETTGVNLGAEIADNDSDIAPSEVENNFFRPAVSPVETDEMLEEAVRVLLSSAIGGLDSWSPVEVKDFLEYERRQANRLCSSGPVHLNLRWAPPLTPEIPADGQWQWPAAEIPVFDPTKPLVDLRVKDTGEWHTTLKKQIVHPGDQNEILNGRLCDNQIANTEMVPESLTAASGAIDSKLMTGEQTTSAADYSAPALEFNTFASLLPPRQITAKTVVIAGDQSRVEVLKAASRHGIPILAEPTAPILRDYPAISHSSLAVGDFLAEIDQVILTGHPTLSRPFTQLLSRTDIPIYVVNPGLPHVDLSGTGQQLSLRGWHRMLEDIPAAVAQELRKWSCRWWKRSAEIEQKFVAYTVETAKILDEQGIIDPYLLARICMDQHSRADAPAIFLGASNTIRAFDLAINYCCNCPDGKPNDKPLLFANRGLAGIDGTTSTALGMAIGAGEPFRVFCGDLTFLHDLTGLIRGLVEPTAQGGTLALETHKTSPDVEKPNLDLFVLNDQGGQIFASLEHGRSEYKPVFERFFHTPQAVNIAALAAGLGWEYQKISNLAQLQAALGRLPQGLRIYELNTAVPDYRQVRENFFAGL